MLVDKDEQQWVMITLEEYKNLLMAYVQYCMMIQPATKEKTKELIGFK